MKTLSIIIFLAIAPLSIFSQNICYDGEYAQGEYATGEYIESEDVCEIKIQKPPLSIFPNPTVDFFEVRNLENIEGELLDLHGRLIRRIDVSVIIDVSNLPNGLYFLRSNNQIVKVVKQ